VFIHAEGPAHSLDALERGVVAEAPPLARPVLASTNPVSNLGLDSFTIEASDDNANPEIHVPPDQFTCVDCVRELEDPARRRFAYPFINCTQCGPRYTLITAMPYDRPNTSMRDFPLCNQCRAEYESPMDRRFHAQPLACPVCGPQLSFIDTAGELTPNSTHSLEKAVKALDEGLVVAVKGIGGYHLVCDAANDEAVSAIRERKRRPDKPLAVMFPLRGPDGLDAVREALSPGQAEAAALLDPARPIVLITRRKHGALSELLAPGLRELGAFLPYSPLHHVLLSAFGRPVVATSGNISGEPVITDNDDAQQRLAEIADVFLHHDRPIVRPADDPVLRVIRGKARSLRPGRGMAPVELPLPFTLRRPLLATGGHMKNTVALAWDDRAILSPHIGELDTPRSRDVFLQVITDLQALYGVSAEAVVCDLHPGYWNSRWARAQQLPVVRVQHHAAHAAALAGEHPEFDQWLTFAWDGVGLGPDQSLWGGEALLGRPGNWLRAASFRPFRLGGGDRAGREPWRSAAALQWTAEREWQPSIRGAKLAHEAWQRQVNTHETTAAGRLFDAAACLVLGCELTSFEGQGPMLLEQAATPGETAIRLPLAKDPEGCWRSDWTPLLELLQDRGLDTGVRAFAFHQALARTLVDQALAIRAESAVEVVGLSGGVFQNRLLSELAAEMLTEAGFEVRMHRVVPANDGGLAFGQIMEAGARQ
jgi:hydrogenase maturation protein HypF